MANKTSSKIEDKLSQGELREFIVDYFADESTRDKQRIFEKDHYIHFLEHSRFFLLGQAYRDYKQLLGWYLKRASFGLLLSHRLKNFDKGVVSARRRREWHRLVGDPQDYSKWLKENETYDRSAVMTEIAAFKSKPKISIIVPVYNVEPKWLNICIKSVVKQLYTNWELCLYDDASTSADTLACLHSWQKKNDPRIKIQFGSKNMHISGASNEAIKQATGEFIALLDNDDEVSPFALYEFAKIYSSNPTLDLAYSDEDKIDLKGKRKNPYFKPDFSPELLMSQMYISHLGFYRKSLVDKIGGFRLGYEGSQDYDLALRMSEVTSNIVHIPKILYHWRVLETSTANGQDAKPYTVTASVKTLENYAKRNNLKASVVTGISSSLYRLRLEVVGNPSVTIIIPFKDQAKLLKSCVMSIVAKTDYKNYQILLVNNNSEAPETTDALAVLDKMPNVSIIDYKKPFNYSAINNYAVSKVDSDYVLLLNNDTEIISPEWLTAMLEHAQKKEVGAVGAKLLFGNDKVQHAGVVMGLGIAGHAFKYFSDSDPGYFSRANSVCNYAAVTAACLLVDRKKYLEVGGLNEKELGVAYNDVDFCLRLLEAGYRNVYTPYAKLYHYESVSRGDDNITDIEHTNPEKYQRVVSERHYMYKTWAKYIKNDPYYSPNLTRVHEDFSLRFLEDEIQHHNSDL